MALRARRSVQIAPVIMSPELTTLLATREQLRRGTDFVQCPKCKGERGDFDTTYDRTGSWTWCRECRGAGIVPQFQSELLKMLRGKPPGEA